MGISAKTLKILAVKSGNRCAFPECRRLLVSVGNVVTGEVAHIVAESSDGPRGVSPLTIDERNSPENLIYLCPEHHKTIDDQPEIYTVPKLLQMKRDHESWVDGTLSFKERFEGIREPAESVVDTVHSTILPVLRMPQYVYEADTEERSEQDAKALVSFPDNKEELTPFLLHGGKLIAFHDLSSESNPFVAIADPYTCERSYSKDWWDDPDQYRLFVRLLNRTLNKVCGRKGLMLDKEHNRYYFTLDEGKTSKTITYRPLNLSKAKRNVVWRPKTRITGLEKKYYEHYAVNLKFHRVSEDQWCLSIRPERRFTKDGKISLESERIGPRSTRLKSRMYNIDLLEEINFWRDFFAAHSPRISLKFGQQRLIISTELMSAQIRWPGIPGDSKPFKNIKYEENLFSLADLMQVVGDDEGEDVDDSGDDEGLE